MSPFLVRESGTVSLAPKTLLRLCWLKLRQACLLESPLRLGTDLPRVAGKAGLFHLVAIGGKAFRVE